MEKFDGKGKADEIASHRCARRSGLVFDGAAQHEGKELGLLGCHCVSRTLWDWRRKAVHTLGRNRRYECPSPNGTKRALLRLLMLARKREASCLLRSDPVRRKMQHSASPATIRASRSASFLSTSSSRRSTMTRRPGRTDVPPGKYDRMSTAVAVLSTRARAGATVSMPLRSDAS